VVFGVVVVCGR